ncbi:protein zwilch homolog isoform 2-T2 [Amazona ochrocephala]
MEAVSLTGITSVQMLLENGLDKMKKDYVSFFIGQELATLTSLDCFISTSVDLQEQVHCVQKLHHVLEIMVSCTVLLQFKHESLFPWTQICINYYRENPPDEKHVFQLPVSSALVKKFYPDHPEVWKVDISSGHGPKEAKTTWQVSTNPPVEHMMSNNTGLLHFHISRFTRTSSLCSKASPCVGNNGQLYSPTSVQTREPLPLDTVIISFYFLLLK